MNSQEFPEIHCNSASSTSEVIPAAREATGDMGRDSPDTEGIGLAKSAQL